jgi:hypothetical protein
MAETLATIDKQIGFLWACYRKWYDLGTETGISPLDAIKEIDALLERRHGLATSQGELHDARDRATDWGAGDTGQPA